MWKGKLEVAAVEAVKFLWKRKHFEKKKLEVEAKIFYCFHIPDFGLGLG